MSGKITDLTSVTIDRAADVFEIVDVSANASKNSTVNNALGITGNPVGDTDVQTVTNKILGTTNTITAQDSTFTIVDNGDTTKKVQFQASGITTGTTRTLTIPDVSDTLVTLAAAQTLTNKTLSSPTLSAPTLTNASITADAITGFTTSNTGTIYGVSVTSGALGTNALATNAVQANQLATSALTLGYAQSTSSLTGASTSYTSTGMGVLVTIPAGGRRVKITVYTSLLSSGSANASKIGLFTGTSVGTLTTQIGEFWGMNSNTIGTGAMLVATHIPAAGSLAYTVALLQSTSGTVTMTASVTIPTFILVEAI